MKANQDYRHKARAEAMYAYVIAQGGRRVSKREIFENVDGYEWLASASDKCPTIRMDMKYVNANPDHDVLIVFEKQQYYAANKKDEARKYYNRKVTSLKTIVEELNVLRRKMMRDGQFDLFGDVHVTFPEDEQ